MAGGEPSGAASTSGSGSSGGSGSGSGSGAPSRQQRVAAPAQAHPLVQYGCSAGFAGVVGTIVVGVFGTITGRQALYSRMLRYRLVLVGTTLGLYTTGTGFIPVPPPLVALFGPPKRAPLQ
ncbi:hypothetical protein Rsub_03371 [Raphidocelis subcapitata]|uniref:Uncharacterized protein n=1 Tax=Raphidocelis subcapitata TaxID=307507 RepID=A0A2V0NRE0_9CHLO|nr:hypothetical protein Rsub_03371 [Raphidocelis subcapitata]|eukprot:GBF90238.1 hypothetical protein Rsub_03371 [Raphidocelis subcapitata]